LIAGKAGRDYFTIFFDRDTCPAQANPIRDTLSNREGGARRNDDTDDCADILRCRIRFCAIDSYARLGAPHGGFEFLRKPICIGGGHIVKADFDASVRHVQPRTAL